MIDENKTHNSLKKWNNRINLEKTLSYFVAKGLIFTLTLAVAETVKFYELITRLK